MTNRTKIVPLYSGDIEWLEQKVDRLIRDIRPSALKSTTASETVKEMYGLKEPEHE